MEKEDEKPRELIVTVRGDIFGKYELVRLTREQFEEMYPDAKK
jgi:hypothetical protein